MFIFFLLLLLLPSLTNITCKLHGVCESYTYQMTALLQCVGEDFWNVPVTKLDAKIVRVPIYKPWTQ